MRVLLIESAERLRAWLTSAFREAGIEIEAVADGELGIDLARRSRPDVVVLDAVSRGRNGIDLLVRLRKKGPDTRVIILTPRFSVEDRVRGLQSGADDCLPKPFYFEELLARVRVLVRHRGHSAKIRIDDLVIDTAGRQVTRDGTTIELTRREFEILELLAQRRGEFVSRCEIEGHLYTEDEAPLSNAVASAICHLRKKLTAVGGRGDLVHTRRGLGYTLGLPEPG